MAASSCNTERSETTRSEFSDFVLVVIDDVLGETVIFLDRSEDVEGCALDANDTFAFRGFDDSRNFLGDRVEGVEFDDFVPAENTLCPGIVPECFEESLIKCIETFSFPRGGETSRKNEIVGINTFDSVRLVKGKLIFCQGTSSAQSTEIAKLT